MNIMVAGRAPKKPNFLIVGAAKCGTTSLFRYLSQHPEIFMPRWKEPSFFIGDPFKPLNRATKSVYYKLFNGVRQETAVGEASVAYLFDKAAPNLIKEALGDIKIIILLRDPVQMSYSLYNHQVRKEGELLNNFEAALDAEKYRQNNLSFRKHCYGWHANYYYYQRSLYYEQIKRYLEIFNPDDVLIIRFEDMAADPVNISRKTYRFLGVDDSFLPEIKIHNPAGEIFKIPKFWQDKGLLIQTTSFIFSLNSLKKIWLLVRNVGRKKPPPINPKTVISLRNRLQDDICRLEKLIGKELSAWKC